MIRVLRLLEYTYPDAESMERDMSRWTHSIPKGNKSMSMRSASLPPTVIDDNEVFTDWTDKTLDLVQCPQTTNHAPCEWEMAGQRMRCDGKHNA